MDRSSRFIIRKIVIDFFCILVVGLTVLSFFIWGQPYRRGFFCDDESLMHPFKESTVTSFMLYVTGLFLPICTMTFLEFHRAQRSPEKKPLVLFGRSIPHWMVMAYEKIGVFGFGAACTVMTTDIAKYTIGRLRPHFLSVCDPDVCAIESNHHRYFIDGFVCRGQFSQRIEKELRLSFPSGHSSFSAYTMVYLALYLQLRFTWSGSKLLRHLLQFMCIMMAWFTAMSRVSNYKHHWSDVLVGMLLGTVIALIMVFCVADLFKERRLRWLLGRHEQMNEGDKLRTREYETPSSTTPGGVNAPISGPVEPQVTNGTGNRIC